MEILSHLVILECSAKWLLSIFIAQLYGSYFSFIMFRWKMYTDNWTNTTFRPTLSLSSGAQFNIWVTFQRLWLKPDKNRNIGRNVVFVNFIHQFSMLQLYQLTIWNESKVTRLPVFRLSGVHSVMSTLVYSNWMRSQLITSTDIHSRPLELLDFELTPTTVQILQDSTRYLPFGAICFNY